MRLTSAVCCGEAAEESDCATFSDLPRRAPSKLNRVTAESKKMSRRGTPRNADKKELVFIGVPRRSSAANNVFTSTRRRAHRHSMRSGGQSLGACRQECLQDVPRGCRSTY